MNDYTKTKQFRTQSGATLVIALVILLVLTILAVAVMQSSTLEEKLAGNYLERNRVFQAAESALRAGESAVHGWTSIPIAGEGGVFALNTPGGGGSQWWANTTDEWWNTNATDYARTLVGINDADATNNPQYVIEQYGFDCGIREDVMPNTKDCKIVYRITARAQSIRNSEITLQSLFAEQF